MASCRQFQAGFRQVDWPISGSLRLTLSRAWALLFVFVQLRGMPCSTLLTCYSIHHQYCTVRGILFCSACHLVRSAAPYCTAVCSPPWHGVRITCPAASLTFTQTGSFILPHHVAASSTCCCADCQLAVVQNHLKYMKHFKCR